MPVSRRRGIAAHLDTKAELRGDERGARLVSGLEIELPDGLEELLLRFEVPLAASAQGQPQSGEIRAAGVSLILPWDGLGEIPPFNEDEEGRPPRVVVAMREALRAHDALWIATPEYNASILGQLKNAIDWASRPYGEAVLIAKPVAVLSTSMGAFGGKWARDALRHVLEQIGAVVAESGFALDSAHERFDEQGRLRDAARAAAVRGVVDELVALSRREPANA